MPLPLSGDAALSLAKILCTHRIIGLLQNKYCFVPAEMPPLKVRRSSARSLLGPQERGHSANIVVES